MKEGNQKYNDQRLLSLRNEVVGQIYKTFIFYSVPIFFSFILVDYYLTNNFLFFLFGRGSISILSFCLFLPMARNKLVPRLFKILPFILFSSYNGFITYSMYVYPIELKFYFVGLIVVSSGMTAVFVNSYKQVLFANLLTFLGYCLIIVLRGDVFFQDLNFLVLSISFLATSAIVNTLASRSVTQITKKGFSDKYKLRYERIRRDQIIRSKAKELALNELLNSQFSPQISKMFKEGLLNMDEFQNHTISILVIDVVNSTKKLSELEPRSAYIAIERTFDIIAGTLLKYDITVDKFTGDGVMALSNAPVKYANHFERCVEACIEINIELQENNLILSEHWNGPVQLRYSLHTGIASYGFVGRGKVKSFTALGKSVNLAHRINQFAETDSLVVTGSSLREKEFSIKRLEIQEQKIDKVDCKGFEDPVEIVKFSFLKSNTPKLINKDLYCDCGKELKLKASRHGKYELVCDSC